MVPWPIVVPVAAAVLLAVAIAVPMGPLLATVCALMPLGTVVGLAEALTPIIEGAVRTAGGARPAPPMRTHPLRVMSRRFT